MTDFAEAMKQERARLNATKQELTSQMDDLIIQVSGIDKELKALDAYERAKSGATASKRRSGIRAEVLEIIQKVPNGISRADLLATMDAQGNKSRAQSISNALAALKKAGTVSSDDGIYKVV